MPRGDRLKEDFRVGKGTSETRDVELGVFGIAAVSQAPRGGGKKSKATCDFEGKKELKKTSKG